MGWRSHHTVRLRLVGRVRAVCRRLRVTCLSQQLRWHRGALAAQRRRRTRRSAGAAAVCGRAQPTLRGVREVGNVEHAKLTAQLAVQHGRDGGPRGAACSSHGGGTASSLPLPPLPMPMPAMATGCGGFVSATGTIEQGQQECRQRGEPIAAAAAAAAFMPPRPPPMATASPMRCPPPPLYTSMPRPMPQPSHVPVNPPAQPTAAALLQLRPLSCRRVHH